MHPWKVKKRGGGEGAKVHMSTPKLFIYWICTNSATENCGGKIQFIQFRAGSSYFGYFFSNFFTLRLVCFRFPWCMVAVVASAVATQGHRWKFATKWGAGCKLAFCLCLGEEKYCSIQHVSPRKGKKMFKINCPRRVLLSEQIWGTLEL
jgi:hypothetical protein